LPSKEGPQPAAIILAGSGPLDRDAVARRMPLGISRALADALADHGVASLRYDKRGVRDSPGSWIRSGLYDNVADAEAALTWLRSRRDVRSDGVFVVGHSEGAYLACALAGRPAYHGLAGVVLLAASAKTGAQTLAWQARRMTESLPGGVLRVLRSVGLDPLEQQARRRARLRATSHDVERIRCRRVNARWFREMLDFDPKPGLARLDVPVLAITGDSDLQVDPDDLDAIAAVVPAPVVTVRVPELTHVLRRDPDPPSVARYRKLVRKPVDTEVLRLVADWIVEHTPAR
jgi:pimeloyl-ACP methyl ester carboxylesterase